MNDRFFSLPEEKQQAIINAGFRVFAQNSYRKSPMGEIAAAAGISKALLFHYFQNKRELYLFLWHTCARMTAEQLAQYDCYAAEDVFEMMRRGLRAKVQLMRRYPYMTAFSLKAFYEKDPAVCGAIQSDYRSRVDGQFDAVLARVSGDRFRSGLDVRQMYRQMCWACEGYLWEKLQGGELRPDEVEEDFERMMAFWETAYLEK